MAEETQLTIIGNLTADPEVHTTPNGANFVSFTVAHTDRQFNRQSNQWEDGGKLFMRCSAWRALADHVAQSLHKGMRVIVHGSLSQRSYQAKDGSNRTVVELRVDEIGPSLRYVTAQVVKAQQANGFQPGSQPPQPPQQQYQPQPQNFQQPPQQNYQQSPADPWSGSNDGFGGPDDPTF